MFLELQTNLDVLNLDAMSSIIYYIYIRHVYTRLEHKQVKKY